jgi:hypothetical protein
MEEGGGVAGEETEVDVDVVFCSIIRSGYLAEVQADATVPMAAIWWSVAANMLGLEEAEDWSGQ